MGNNLVRLKRSDEINKHYKMGEIIGRGSFATVRRAVSKTTGKAVAIKVIKKKKLTADELAIVHNEVEILHKVKHPNCCELIELFESNRKIYMVMELMSGGELFEQIVGRGCFPEAEAKDLIRSVISALAYLHSIGIVHRDLKPENLLYATSQQNSPIKITDFGLAKYRSLKDKTEGMHTSCGTPGYVSPEMLRREAYTEATDMWSLGIIMYVVLCGFPPFYHESNALLFEAIKNGEYDFPAPYWTNISAEAKDLIRHLLCIDVSARYTAEQALDHPWLRTGKEALSPKSSQDTQLKQAQLLQARLRIRRVALMVYALNKLGNTDITENEAGVKSTIGNKELAHDDSASVNTSSTSSSLSSNIPRNNMHIEIPGQYVIDRESETSASVSPFRYVRSDVNLTALVTSQ